MAGINIYSVLKYLIGNYEKINGDGFKLYYLKTVFPPDASECEREKMWSLLPGAKDENHCWKEYKRYPALNPTVYFTLVGTNVSEGVRAIEKPMKETAKLLLLRNYEPENMPSVEEFLGNYSTFTCMLDSEKEPYISQQQGEPYLWFEFILKLSQEQDYLIKPQKHPHIPDTFGFRTRLLDLSMHTLKYLLEKAVNKQTGDVQVAQEEDISSKGPDTTKKQLPSGLTSKQYEAFKLYNDNMTQKQIGEKLGISQSSVSERLQRARKKCPRVFRK